MEPLTPREKECLDLIEAYFRQWGKFPSVTFCSNQMGLEFANGASQYFTKLEEKRYIVVVGGRRTLASLDDTDITLETNGIKVFRLMEQELWRSGA